MVIKIIKGGIPIIRRDASLEILARIARVVARKCGCDIKIDFQDGELITEFIGDKTNKPLIVEDVENIFFKDE